MIMKKKAGLLDYILTDPFSVSSDHWRNLFDETLDSIQNSITALVNSLRERESERAKMSKEQLLSEARFLEAVINFLRNFKNEPKYAWEVDKLAFNPDGTVKAKYLIDTLSLSLLSLYSCTLKQLHGKVNTSILASIFTFGKKEKEKGYKDYEEFLEELYRVFKERSDTGVDSLLQELESRRLETLELLYQSQARIGSIVLNRIFDANREEIVLNQLKSTADKLDEEQIERVTSALRILFCSIASGGLATNRACLSSLGGYLGISDKIADLEKAILSMIEEESEEISGKRRKSSIQKGGADTSQYARLLREKILESTEIKGTAQDFYRRAYSRLLFLAKALYTLYPVYTKGKDKYPKCGKFNISPALTLMKTYLDRVFKNFLSDVEVNISDTPEGIASGAAAILTYFVVDTILAKITDIETDRVYSEFYGIADYLTGDVNGWLDSIKSVSREFFEEVKNILNEIKNSLVKRSSKQGKEVLSSIYKFSQESKSFDFSTEGVDDKIVELINNIIKNADSRSIPKELEDKAKEILNKAFGSDDNNILYLFYLVAVYNVVLRSVLNTEQLSGEVKEKIIANVKRANELFSNLSARVETFLLYIDKVILSAGKEQGTEKTEGIKKKLVSRLSEARELKEKAVNNVKFAFRKLLSKIDWVGELTGANERIIREVVRRAALRVLGNKELIDEELCPAICELEENLGLLEASFQNLSEEEQEKVVNSILDSLATKRIKDEISSIVVKIAEEISREDDNPTLFSIVGEALSKGRDQIVRGVIKIVARKVIDDKVCKCGFVGNTEEGEVKSGSIIIRGKRVIPNRGYDIVVRSLINPETFAKSMLLAREEGDDFVTSAIKAAVLVDPILRRYFNNLREIDKKLAEPSKKVKVETVRKVRKDLLYAINYTEYARDVLSSDTLWERNSPYEFENVLKLTSTIKEEIIEKLDEILSKYPEGKDALSEEDSRRFYGLLETARKILKKFVSNVVLGYSKYIGYTEPKIKKALESTEKKYQEVFDNVMAGFANVDPKVMAENVRNLERFSKIIWEKGIDKKGETLDEILRAATTILNDANVKNAYNTLSKYVGKLYTIFSALEAANKELNRYVSENPPEEIGGGATEEKSKVLKSLKDLKKLKELVVPQYQEKKDQDSGEAVGVKLEKFLNLVTKDGDLLKQLREDLKVANLKEVQKTLSTVYEKLNRIDLSSLKSGDSIFGFSNDNIVKAFEEIIGKLFSEIKDATSVNPRKILNSLYESYEAIEVIKEIFSEEATTTVESETTTETEEKPPVKVEEKPTPKVEEKPSVKVEEKPTPKVEEKPTAKVEEEPPVKVEEKPIVEAEEEQAVKVVEEPTAKVEEEPAAKAEGGEEIGVGETDTGKKEQPKSRSRRKSPSSTQTKKQTGKKTGVFFLFGRDEKRERRVGRPTNIEKLRRFVESLRSLEKALKDADMLVVGINNAYDLASNLTNMVKYHRLAHIEPVYYLIAKSLGLDIFEFNERKKSISKIFNYVDPKEVRKWYGIAQNVMKSLERETVQERKVEVPKVEEKVEEEITKPEKTEVPEVSRPVVEERAVKPEEVVEPKREEPVEIKEEVKPEEKVVKVEPKKEEPVKPEEPAKPEEPTKPEEEVKPKEEVTEVKPEVKEKEIDVNALKEVAEKLRESIVGGTTIEDLKELENEDDREIAVRLNRLLSEKASKGEIHIVNELKLLYPVLYLVGGRDLAKLVANYYSSHLEGFATFTVRVRDEEKLNEILNSKKLSPKEKKAISEIKRRMQDDDEISEALKDAKKLKKNLGSIVGKIIGIVKDVQQSYKGILDGISAKSSEQLSFRTEVSKSTIQSIRNYIRKNIKILDTAREVIPEDAISPTILDESSKVEILDRIFRIEGEDILYRHLPKTFAEKLKSIDVVLDKDGFVRILNASAVTFYTKLKEKYTEGVPSLWHSLGALKGDSVLAMKGYIPISERDEEAPPVIPTISSEKFKMLVELLQEHGVTIPNDKVEKISNLMNVASIVSDTAETFVNGTIAELFSGKGAIEKISDAIVKGINEAFGFEETSELSESVKRIPDAKTKDLVRIASGFSEGVKGSLKDVLDKSGVDIDKIVDTVYNDILKVFIEYAENKKIKISDRIKAIYEKVERLPIGKDMKKNLKDMLSSAEIRGGKLLLLMDYLLKDTVYVNVIILRDLLKSIADGYLVQREKAEGILKEVLEESIFSDVPESKRKSAIKNFLKAIQEEAIIPPLVLDLPIGRDTKFGKIFFEMGETKIDEDEFLLFAQKFLGELRKIAGRFLLSGMLDTKDLKDLWYFLAEYFKGVQGIAASFLIGSVSGDPAYISIRTDLMQRYIDRAKSSLDKIKKMILERYESSKGEEPGIKKADFIEVINEAKQKLDALPTSLSVAAELYKLTKPLELSQILMNIVSLSLIKVFNNLTGKEFDEFKAAIDYVNKLSGIISKYVTFISRTGKIGFVDDLPEIAALVASYQKRSSKKVTSSLSLSIVKRAAVGDELDLETLAEMLYNIVEQEESVAHYYLLQKVLQAIAIRDSIANGLPVDLFELVKELKSNELFLGLATLQFAINKL
jgi:hypothetical protein